MTNNGSSYFVQLDQFDKNIKRSWQELQYETDLCDVTLACADKQILAHKIILSCSSPVLRNIIKQNSSQHPVIYLRGVKYEHVKDMVNFMYQGEVTIEEEDLPNFIDIAQDLKIKGISESHFNSKSKLTQEKKTINSEERRIDSNISPEMEYGCMQKPKLLNPAGQEVTSLAESIFSPNFNFHCKTSIKERKSLEKNRILEKKDIGIHKPVLISPSVEMVRIDICEGDGKPESILKESITAIKNENRNNISPSFDKGRHYKCNKCEKVYSAFTSLQKHTQSVHEGLKYSCDQCDHLPFNDPSHLRQHKASVHEGIRYPCDQCDYSATRKYQLKMHRHSIHK